MAAEPKAIYLNTIPTVNVYNFSGWTGIRTRLML
jgi:hypothetical protein